jgi:hypothetical protein
LLFAKAKKKTYQPNSFLLIIGERNFDLTKKTVSLIYF